MKNRRPVRFTPASAPAARDRVPAGVPSGGQFATGSRAEAAVALAEKDAPAATTTDEEPSGWENFKHGTRVAKNVLTLPAYVATASTFMATQADKVQPLVNHMPEHVTTTAAVLAGGIAAAAFGRTIARNSIQRFLHPVEFARYDAEDADRNKERARDLNARSRERYPSWYRNADATFERRVEETTEKVTEKTKAAFTRKPKD